jgi:hypothetical protein
MAATQKPKTRSRTTAAARARAEEDAHRLDRVSATVEAAQKDLASIGGSVGTGVRDLRRDVSRMLRDARRDLGKMRRAVQRDIERLQDDLSSAAMAKQTGARRSTKKAPRTSRRATASHSR